MFSLRVREVMTRAPVVVRADLPLKDVASVLFERGVSGVPVLDQDGRAIGMVFGDGPARVRGSAVELWSAARMLVRRSERVSGVTGVLDRLSWDDDDPDRVPAEDVEPVIASVQRIVRLG